MADPLSMDGPRLLRTIVREMDDSRESFNQLWSATQLVKIYEMHLRSEWEFPPDRWTERQVREALAGIVLKFHDDGKPNYTR